MASKLGGWVDCTGIEKWPILDREGEVEAAIGRRAGPVPLCNHAGMRAGRSQKAKDRGDQWQDVHRTATAMVPTA
jgi:hypothetical protein